MRRRPMTTPRSTWSRSGATAITRPSAARWRRGGGWSAARRAGCDATIGGSRARGLWMLGGAERLLDRARPGVLFADLTACNEYRDALAAAAKVTVPAAVILGGRDLMTPTKSGKAIAAAIPAG